MPKNIVILFDGTSNEISADRTNILRLYGTLEKSDHQLVYYDPGVGTFGAENILSFYHAKHGALSLGASPFHVAVSQAMKNLGRLSLPPDAMPRKSHRGRRLIPARVRRLPFGEFCAAATRQF